jgi:hypothetical protein
MLLKESDPTATQSVASEQLTPLKNTKGLNRVAAPQVPFVSVAEPSQPTAVQYPGAVQLTLVK